MTVCLRTLGLIHDGTDRFHAKAQSTPSPQRKAGTSALRFFAAWRLCVNCLDLLTITKVEREEFQKLTNDEDRQKFVEQFRERRNPHAGAPLC